LLNLFPGLLLRLEDLAEGCGSAILEFKFGVQIDSFV
jgi:hypothetical protein